jgi:hypothetical protein
MMERRDKEELEKEKSFILAPVILKQKYIKKYLLQLLKNVILVMFFRFA